MRTRRGGRRDGNGGVDDPSGEGVGGVAAANMPPRDDPADSPQRQTNLLGVLLRVTRRCARAAANIVGKKGGSDAPPGDNASEDVSLAPGARGAQANAPIAAADAPAARKQACVTCFLKNVNLSFPAPAHRERCGRVAAGAATEMGAWRTPLGRE